MDLQINCAYGRRKVSMKFTNRNRHLKSSKIKILRKSAESVHNNIKSFFESFKTNKNHDVHGTHQIEATS